MTHSHKSQHWIPRSYLEMWTDPDCPDGYKPFVHVFRKDGTDHERRAPHNIFAEPDLYTIKRPDGSRDLKVERELSRLEKDFVRIRDVYLAHREILPFAEYMVLLVFVAAMHARTPASRDHHASHWSDVLKLMDELEERMKNATPEQKRAASISLGPTDPKKTMSHAQVRKIVANPMQHFLGPMVRAVAEPLARMMHCIVLCTESSPGFITSDAPVVWFDPEAYKRPPMFRSPAFMYASTEITLPISPQQLLLFTRGTPGLEYRALPDILVEDINRRTRALCDQHFVVCREVVKPFWLDLGKMPHDAWDVIHADEVEDGAEET